MRSAAPALTHLVPAWFAIPMGLCGLALAWHRAGPLMGELTAAIALVLGLAALAVWLALAGASLLRLQRHPQAWRDDCRHPVRHAFVAAVPIGALLLATVATALLGPTRATMPPLLGALVDALWWAGSLGQFAVTLWVLSRWWQANKPGGLQWQVLTPALIIPVVGNVLAPLAGVSLGHPEWAAAQFGVGLLFWPVVLVLLLVRVASQGLWPERLLPAHFILVAPPAVIGLSLLQLGAPLSVAWAMWGAALFCLLWAGSQARRLAALPFGIAHWGLSFPLAAFTALTLRLAEGGGLLAVLGPMLLALSSLVILGLSMATWRGLRDGSLLAPETIAAIQPVAAR
jgi:tellurite resistance protein